MGFSSVFSDLTPSVILRATQFVSDFSPFLAIVTGIAVAGYAIVVIRRFI